MCDSGAIQWVEDIFGDCIVTPLDNVSFAIGLLSTLICLTSSLPQVILNCRRRQVKGQSLLFFIFLFIGSCLSLVGVIITKGLITQILQAIVYALLDAILVCQFITYKYILKTHKLSISTPDSQEGGASKEASTPPIQSTPSTPPIPMIVAGMVEHVAAVDLTAPYRGEQLLGTVFGWIGAVIFCSARIPQIRQNLRTKSVQNLSVSYIAMMIVGNLTYAIAVFLRGVESSYIWKQAPFLTGVLGPMVCDCVLLFQKWLYAGHEPSYTGEEEDIDESRRVSEL
jgi:uncharacterized protein with PQ loop repeat